MTGGLTSYLRHPFLLRPYILFHKEGVYVAASLSPLPKVLLGSLLETLWPS